jgi:membrane protease YdiL (CAAX protease family)
MNFIQQAFKGNKEWYWYLITISVVFVFWQILGVIPLAIVAFLKTGNLADFERASLDAFASIGIESNFYLFLVLFTLIMGLVGLLISIKFIHKRAIKTVITSRNSIDWKRVFYAFGLWFTVSIILMLIAYSLAPEDLIWNFKLIPFLILVIISFLFIPLQTSFEELLFRGYLMQGLGVLVKNKWLPLLLTSAVFGLLHGANPEVAKLGYGLMVYYIGTGLFFGIITLMDEGTELALGLHAANNIVAAIFVTTNWTVFKTEALFIDISEPSIGWETFVPVVIVYPLMLFIFYKKYGWKDWQEKLTGSIEKPEVLIDEQF